MSQPLNSVFINFLLNLDDDPKRGPKMWTYSKTPLPKTGMTVVRGANIQLVDVFIYVVQSKIKTHTVARQSLDQVLVHNNVNKNIQQYSQWFIGFCSDAIHKRHVPSTLGLAIRQQNVHFSANLLIIMKA